jgi:hypothetical protein
MNINNGSSGQNVWSFSPRTLTGLGTALGVNIFADGVNLAASANATIFAPPGDVWLVCIVATPLNNVSWRIGLTGAAFNLRIGAIANTNTSAMQMGVSSNTYGVGITNFGTVSGIYAYSVLQLAT